MYVPRSYAMADPETQALLAAARSGWLVTGGSDGFPLATLLPILWRGERVVMHMARANQHWKTLAPDAPALLIVGGPEAYVSPSWYATKAEHGRVVPTWNYSAVQVSGTVTVHEEPGWLRHAVTELTEAHEADRGHPWQVSDAPEPYVEGQLRAIVGLDFAVRRIEGKAKRSQNRSEADRRGVVAGLERDARDRFAGPTAAGALEVAEAMARDLPAEPE